MNRPSYLLVILALSASIFLQSCAPDIPFDMQSTKNKIKLPETYLGQTLKSETSSVQNWQSFFKDPVLLTLIETALKNNQELRIIEQEIEISKNEVSARQGEYLPQVNVGTHYEHERVGEFTSQGVSDEHHELPKILKNREAGFYASWEVDIWKKLRNAKQSAYYRYLSTIEGKKFATTFLISEIANSYFKLMALKEQVEIVKHYVDILEQGLKIVNYQKEAASATSLAVERYEAEVHKNKSHFYEISQKMTLVENRLNRLVGRFPENIVMDSTQFLDKQMFSLNIGMPTELLENRPDVKQAMLNMQAAELDVQVAKARFYPSLSLDGNLGLQSFNAKEFLTTPASVFYVLGANLTAPVFNRLAIEADFKSANNKQLQSIYEYQKTLINAYVEVMNQKSNIYNTEKNYEFKTKQVANLTNAINVADTLFKAARIDYLEVLLTQRDALEAQIEQIETKQQQIGAYVNLYRALGGGWDKSPS